MIFVHARILLFHLLVIKPRFLFGVGVGWMGVCLRGCPFDGWWSHYSHFGWARWRSWTAITAIFRMTILIKIMFEYTVKFWNCDAYIIVSLWTVERIEHLVSAFRLEWFKSKEASARFFVETIEVLIIYFLQIIALFLILVALNIVSENSPFTGIKFMCIRYCKERN